MDLSADSITKIQEICAPISFTLKDVHGIETVYASKTLQQVKAAAPEEAEFVPVSTLAGFAALVTAKLEGQNFPDDFLIHIEDEQTVVLKARVSDQFGRRLELAKAQPVAFKKFQFGSWMNQEEFVIAVASLFAETEDKDYVLRTASALTSDATRTDEDNGFTQRVNLRAGLRTKEDVTIKARVDLAPYRTFPEVQQPVSQFVLRARCAGEGQTPSLMLVEADGGRWKVAAIAMIRTAVEAFDLNIPIIA